MHGILCKPLSYSICLIGCLLAQKSSIVVGDFGKRISNIVPQSLSWLGLNLDPSFCIFFKLLTQTTSYPVDTIYTVKHTQNYSTFNRLYHKMRSSIISSTAIAAVLSLSNIALADDRKYPQYKKYHGCFIIAMVYLLEYSSMLTCVSIVVPVAAVVNNNPQGVKYQADFTKESTVTGSVSFEATKNGTGVTVTVDLANFPTEGGPFLYVSFIINIITKIQS